MLKIQYRVLLQRRLVMAVSTFPDKKYFEEYFKIDSLLFEIKEHLRQSGGYAGDIEALQRHLQLAIEREFVKPFFKRDMTKECGWILEEEGPKHPKGLTVEGLKLQESFNYDEKFIRVDELQEKVKKFNSNFGQHTAEYLFDHQTEIPEEWRNLYLVFPGTVWRNPYLGSLYVPYLIRSGEKWHMCIDWIGVRLSGYARLVVSRATDCDC